MWQIMSEVYDCCGSDIRGYHYPSCDYCEHDNKKTECVECRIEALESKVAELTERLDSFGDWKESLDE